MIPFVTQTAEARWDPAFVTGVALHFALLALVCALALRALSAGRLKRIDVGLGVAAIGAFTAWLFASVPSSAIPIDWVTPLQEGLDTQSIATLYGEGVHAGGGFRFLTLAFADGPVPGVRDVVRMNLWLAGVNAALFFLIARHVLARVWTAGLFTLAFVANLVYFHAALSELPSQAITGYVLLGFVACALRGDDPPPWVRWCALGALGLATLLTGKTRAETAGLGLLALAFSIAPMVLGEARWRQLGERAFAWLRGIPDWSRWKKALAIALLVLVPLPLHSVGWQSGSMVEALHPLYPSFLTLPPVMLLLWFPWPVVVLSTLGIVHGVRHLGRFLGFPIGVLILYKLYFGASHFAFYEVLRYLTLVTPSVVLLGLFGWRELEGIAERRGWSRRALRLTTYGLALLVCVPPMPGLPEHLHHGDFVERFGLHQVLVTRNLQRQTRYLLEVTERHPECVFVARTSHVDHNEGPIREYDHVAFGGPLDGIRVFPAHRITVEEVVAEAAPDAPCARAFYGLDCNLINSDGCRDFVEGRPLLESRRFGTRPYNDIPERGETGPVVELRVYEVALP